MFYNHVRQGIKPKFLFISYVIIMLQFMLLDILKFSNPTYLFVNSSKLNFFDDKVLTLDLLPQHRGT
jgi:hypothetical protein